MPELTSDQMIKWLERFAALIAENKDHLTQLDSAIGDADHGANMDRGFKAVLGKKTEFQGKDIATVFKTVAMTLISTVGGASGPLYGTFFLQAGLLAAGKSSISAEEFGALLEKGLNGVIQRGKANPGDKTMIDAMQPAIEAYRKAVQGGESLDGALKKAAKSSREGMKATIPLVAKKGRASYLGERSAGHQDPGSTSTALLFQAAAESLGD
ncbi:MAG: phosphoenolpyruvate---glycerone phosphotransferase subunit DhaL [Verrucomicrobiota bacterium]|jgi:dihydroxyacetone kinase-like protein